MKRVLILILVAILVTGCAPKPTSDADEAQTTLIRFMELLNVKEYEQALPFYGGSYEGMQTWNPDVTPTDHVSLWQRACEQNGLMCLEVRTAALKEVQGDIFIFQVEFSNPDGSLFVLGPCCGASEEEMPPVSQFEYRVMKNTEGKFVVLDIPPYVP